MRLSQQLQSQLLRPQLTRWMLSRRTIASCTPSLSMRLLSAMPQRIAPSPSRLMMQSLPHLGLRSFSVASTKHDFSKENKPASKFGQLMREYGPLSILVYAFFSSITFICCLSSIYFLGVDRRMILDWIHRAKQMVGLEAERTEAEKQKQEQQDEEDTTEAGKKSFFDFLPEPLKSEAVITLGTNVLLAMVMTKMFLPVKVTLVAFVTPMVAKRLRSMGFNFGQKGAYGNAAKTVRDNMKERRSGN
ncbi:hypothetical protein BDR26DRAFT_1003175 [Obelidium mucronatum]|nr:hypothetical protein BDR26DRAFT_1003175 [Obelidium mucronatum]